MGPAAWWRAAQGCRTRCSPFPVLGRVPRARAARRRRLGPAAPGRGTAGPQGGPQRAGGAVERIAGRCTQPASMTRPGRARSARRCASRSGRRRAAGRRPRPPRRRRAPTPTRPAVMAGRAADEEGQGGHRGPEPHPVPATPASGAGGGGFASRHDGQGRVFSAAVMGRRGPAGPGGRRRSRVGFGGTGGASRSPAVLMGAGRAGRGLRVRSSRCGTLRPWPVSRGRRRAPRRPGGVCGWAAWG